MSGAIEATQRGRGHRRLCAGVRPFLPSCTPPSCGQMLIHAEHVGLLRRQICQCGLLQPAACRPPPALGGRPCSARWGSCAPFQMLVMWPPARSAAHEHDGSRVCFGNGEPWMKTKEREIAVIISFLSFWKALKYCFFFHFVLTSIRCEIIDWPRLPLKSKSITSLPWRYDTFLSDKFVQLLLLAASYSTGQQKGEYTK